MWGRSAALFEMMISAIISAAVCMLATMNQRHPLHHNRLHLVTSHKALVWDEQTTLLRWKEATIAFQIQSSQAAVRCSTRENWAI